MLLFCELNNLPNYKLWLNQNFFRLCHWIESTLHHLVKKNTTKFCEKLISNDDLYYFGKSIAKPLYGSYCTKTAICFADRGIFETEIKKDIFGAASYWKPVPFLMNRERFWFLYFSPFCPFNTTLKRTSQLFVQIYWMDREN